MTSDFPARQKILGTFFLMARKRTMRTLSRQDLRRER
jgi:hypothetical protein